MDINKVIKKIRDLREEMMTTQSTVGKPGFSSAAPAAGPTAGFDPVMGKMVRRKKYLSLGTGSRKRWMPEKNGK